MWRPWSLNLIPTGSRGSVAAPTRGEWYQPGKITSARAWASYDDGGTWLDVPVKNTGTKVTASVDNTLATDFVTLKVELTDANGKSGTQTLKRFYGIR